jgi:hypothetical protein
MSQGSVLGLDVTSRTEPRIPNIVDRGRMMVCSLEIPLEGFELGA